MTKEVSPYLLSAYGLTWKHGEKIGIEDVSLELEKGQLVAVLGPNGSGKSTLLMMLAGLLNPHLGSGGGQIRVRSLDFFNMSSELRAQKIVYVGSDFRVEFPLTAIEAVRMGRICWGPVYGPKSEKEDTLVRRAMENAACWELRNRDVRSLSGGERQRVSLARALAQDAKIILLDESLSKMDLQHQVQMGEMLHHLCNKEDYLVLLVSHDLNVATQWAREVLVMKHGILIHQGDCRFVINQQVLEDLYPGSRLEILTPKSGGAPKVFFSTTSSTLSARTK